MWNVCFVARSASADCRAQRQWPQQLLGDAGSRYPALIHQKKSALLDELVELSEFHRSSVLRLLRQQPAVHGGPPACAGAGHDSAEVGRRRRDGPQVVQLWKRPGMRVTISAANPRRRYCPH